MYRQSYCACCEAMCNALTHLQSPWSNAGVLQFALNLRASTHALLCHHKRTYTKPTSTMLLSNHTVKQRAWTLEGGPSLVNLCWILPLEPWSFALGNEGCCQPSFHHASNRVLLFSACLRKHGYFSNLCVYAVLCQTLLVRVSA